MQLIPNTQVNTGPKLRPVSLDVTPEAEFLEVIGPKVLRVSLLAFTVTSINGFYFSHF
jgi:hypothetical protein